MKRKREIISAALACIAVITTAAALFSTPALADCAVTINPASSSLNVGQTFTISVLACQQSSVQGYSFKVLYDSSKLGLSGSAKGNYLSACSQESTFFINKSGSAGIDSACMRDTVDSGTKLGTLTFKALASGSSTLQLQGVITLQNLVKANLTLGSGSVTINAGTTTTTTTTSTTTTTRATTTTTRSSTTTTTASSTTTRSSTTSSTSTRGTSTTTSTTANSTTSTTTPAGSTTTTTSPTPSSTTSTLSGSGNLRVFCFNDYDRDGIPDANEPALKGCRFTIEGSTTLTTGDNGDAYAYNLAPGDYTVTQEVPAGWTATSANPQTIGIGSAQLTEAKFGIILQWSTTSTTTAASSTTTTSAQTTTTVQSSSTTTIRRHSGGGGSSSGGDSTAVNPQTKVLNSCNDGIKNYMETDADCGGTCNPCENDMICSKNSDCKSKSCISGLCKKTTCADGLRDGDETDIDCGGACTPCADGGRCTQDADCQYPNCREGLCTSQTTTSTIYRAHTCFNGLKDANEVDVDCGETCGPCGDGKKCDSDANCESDYCYEGTCKTPTCSDGIKNQGEQGTDCAGPCPACATQSTTETTIKRAATPISNATLIAIPILAVLLLLILSRGRKQDEPDDKGSQNDDKEPQKEDKESMNTLEEDLNELYKKDLKDMDVIDSELEELYKKNK